MPLYVKDDEINRLAERARRVLGTRTKGEAVRLALERALAERDDALRARLRDIQRRTLALGSVRPGAEDEKTITDRLWGED